ncbi:hypothetical protein MTBLM1_70040 [Rhodospirillaceae bacterium LM-1]|nr:hypothetical protein MTBLM1_70040 [Rhodospirillaceae bacterium LM-1]
MSDFSMLCLWLLCAPLRRPNLWTEITRVKYGRVGRRYASDLTDKERDVIEPLLPKTRPLGRPKRTLMRKASEHVAYRLPMARLICSPWHDTPFPGGGTSLPMADMPK